MESKKLTIFGLIITILLLVSGCTQGQKIDDGGIIAPSEENDQIGCIEIYQPVCAKQADDTFKTFSNSCKADLDKAKIIYSGECNKENRPAIACTRELIPVCAINELGEKETFANKCLAQNYKIIENNACENDKIKKVDSKEITTENNEKNKEENLENNLICTADYTPVCGIDKTGNQKTFSNECSAGNNKILHKGECK